MPGPRSPYSYDETFHLLLARVQTERPEQVKVTSQKNPTRLRALFNQFRTSWMREADMLRKKKDFDAAQRATDNYNILLPYSCTIAPDGIILTHQRTQVDTIETSGRVEQPLAESLPTPPPMDWKDVGQQQENLVRSLFKPRSAPIIADNPPREPDEKL